MDRQISLAIVAIVAALGLLGVVAITISSIPQVEAKGCPPTSEQYPFGTIPVNASKGRCIQP